MARPLNRRVSSKEGEAGELGAKRASRSASTGRRAVLLYGEMDDPSKVKRKRGVSRKRLLK